MATSITIHEVIEQFDTANVRMLDGDCGLWKELMSHEDDVTLLGAYGGPRHRLGCGVGSIRAHCRRS